MHSSCFAELTILLQGACVRNCSINEQLAVGAGVRRDLVPHVALAARRRGGAWHAHRLGRLLLEGESVAHAGGGLRARLEGEALREDEIDVVGQAPLLRRLLPPPVSQPSGRGDAAGRLIAPLSRRARRRARRPGLSSPRQPRQAPPAPRVRGLAAPPTPAAGAGGRSPFACRNDAGADMSAAAGDVPPLLPPPLPQ
jgi:hypothetical protein